MPKIINPTQTGYVKGRYIGENSTLIQDARFKQKTQTPPESQCFLDFRKAFDTIEWNYLLAGLKRFNSGPIFKDGFELFTTMCLAVS